MKIIGYFVSWVAAVVLGSFLAYFVPVEKVFAKGFVEKIKTPPTVINVVDIAAYAEGSKMRIPNIKLALRNDGTAVWVPESSKPTE